MAGNMQERTIDIPGLEVETVRDGRVLVVSVVGRIGQTDYDRAVESFRQAVSGHRWVIVDGTRTEYLSSNGIGILIYYGREVAAGGGEMVVVAPPEGVLGSTATVILSQALHLFDRREDAEEYLAEKAAGQA